MRDQVIGPPLSSSKSADVDFCDPGCFQSIVALSHHRDSYRDASRRINIIGLCRDPLFPLQTGNLPALGGRRWEAPFPIIRLPIRVCPSTMATEPSYGCIAVFCWISKQRTAGWSPDWGSHTTSATVEFVVPRSIPIARIGPEGRFRVHSQTAPSIAMQSEFSIRP